jgi:hypothetical protein
LTKYFFLIFGQLIKTRKKRRKEEAKFKHSNIQTRTTREGRAYSFYLFFLFLTISLLFNEVSSLIAMSVP